jgi:rare lipoprotein A
MKKIVVLFLGILLVAVPVWAKTDSIGKVVKGKASFYSKSLDGTKTATGEIFRNKNMTAASNHIKLNSWVRVTNLSNGKSVIVRINDRMHPKMAKKGRVVDLSRSAAHQLGFIIKGITKVKVEVVPKNTEN